MTKSPGKFLAACACMLLLPAGAQAASIFVNGTQVDGALMGYKLEKCSATFDDKGDLYLNCPGYNFTFETEEGSAPASGEAKPAQAPAAKTTPDIPAATTPMPQGPTAALPPSQMAEPPKLSAQYVLFSSQSEIGAAGFDIDVFINGVLAVRIKNDDVQVVEDVTKFMKKGENTVTFVARKKPSIRDVQSSKSDFIEIQIAEGAVDPATDSLVIKADTGIAYRVTAAEKQDSTKEMKISAH